MGHNQKQEKSSFLSKVTKVLPEAGHVETLHGDLSGVSGVTPLPLKGAKTLKKARPPDNSYGYEECERDSLTHQANLGRLLC